MPAAKGNDYAKNRAGPIRRGRNALLRVLAADKAEVTAARGTLALDRMWAEQIKSAIAGDVKAAKLVIETLDGKPSQPVSVSGPNGETPKDWVLLPTASVVQS